LLREQVGGDLLCRIGRSDHVRAAERGRFRPIGDLEPDNLAGQDLAGQVDPGFVPGLPEPVAGRAG
jgi:hypothetical protein